MPAIVADSTITMETTTATAETAAVQGPVVPLTENPLSEGTTETLKPNLTDLSKQNDEGVSVSNGIPAEAPRQDSTSSSNKVEEQKAEEALVSATEAPASVPSVAATNGLSRLHALAVESEALRTDPVVKSEPVGNAAMDVKVSAAAPVVPHSTSAVKEESPKLKPSSETTKDEAAVQNDAALAMAALASMFASKPAAPSSVSTADSASTATSHATVPAVVAPAPTVPAVSPPTQQPQPAPVKQQRLSSPQPMVTNDTHHSGTHHPAPVTVKQEQKHLPTAAAHHPSTHAILQQHSQQTVTHPDPFVQQQLAQQEAMATFYAQQQQQQQQQMPMDAAAYFAAAQFQQQQQMQADGGMLQWTAEEILMINQAQEQVNQSALQRAQAAYQMRIQAGANEFQAKEEARLVFMEVSQQLLQVLQTQIQAMYQRKVQMQQLRALEQARLTAAAATKTTMAPSVVAPNLPSAASAIVSPLPTAVAPTAQQKTVTGQGLNFLCQVADDGDAKQARAVEVATAAPANVVQPKQKRVATPPNVVVKEESPVERWRDSLIGKEIEVEYDDQWYPARVVSVDSKGLFVVIYEEDRTEERMRLFENFSAQDPEGDDEFKWRMRSAPARRKSSTPASSSRFNKSKSRRSSMDQDEDEDKGDQEATTVETTAGRKKGEADDEVAANKKQPQPQQQDDIREGRERRAEMRAVANAKRLEEEALANARKADEEAAIIRSKLDEELRVHRSKMEEERKQLDAERKAVEQERAKLAEERKANELILQEIKKLQKGASSSASKKEEEEKVEADANEEQEQQEEEPVSKRRRKITEEEPVEVIGPTPKRKSSSETNNVNSNGKRGPSSKRKAQEEENAAEEGEEEQAPAAAPQQNGRRGVAKGGKKTPTSQEKRKKEEEEEEKPAEVEDEDEEEEDEEKKSKNSPGSGGDVPSVMRWSTRKTMPVKRFQAGLKGKWASGRAPRALGFISKGKFGFVPPGGVDAVSWRVRVWWKDDKKFYNGTVDSFRNGKHKILYDDGDVEWVYLENETIEWFVPDGIEFNPLHIDPELAYGGV